MAVWQLGEAVPQIHPTAYVHPAATVIGDVILDAHASVWPGAVLRADFGAIRVGEGSSVQDNSILHPTSHHATLIGIDSVVGHGAHLEGVVVEDAVLVGSAAIVLDGSLVRTGGVVAAGALVLGQTEVSAGMRAQGVPARMVHHDGTPDAMRARARHYRVLAQRYAADLRPCPAEDRSGGASIAARPPTLVAHEGPDGETK